jgi:rfaE bifunctional protein kinase chain/domain
MQNSLLHKYSHKIKTVKELSQILGLFPRKEKVIMCHGVFDVIHPGHLRHLIYAKGKADKLIVSLTADVHINKGKYRPHIPEALRAANMAAYELVDYVVIDKNPDPLENLQILKPDFFCKGFEYTANGVFNPKTQEEIGAMESYGGKVIFTPGDFVYSSSAFINMSPPDVRYEKLESLLNYEGITLNDLRDTLSKFTQKTVHVVGDTIVDSYTRCEMIGGQTKTPTMSVLYQEKVDYLGGAGIVAKHLKQAGANVIFTTVLGDDPLKDFVLDDLKQSGIHYNAKIDKIRPTVNKNAIVVKDYRLLKIDTLDNATISKDIQDSLCSDLKTTQADAVIFSDFRHGIFNHNTIPMLISAIPEGCFKVADSQVASRWGNITDFQDFDLITPNEREARFSLADQDSGIRLLASNLHHKANCKFLILKLGDKGVLCSRPQKDEDADIDSVFLVDSFVNTLKDPVGAGDALLAYSSLGYLVSQSIVQATILGVLAASCECEFDGNHPVRPKDVLKKIDEIERMINFDISPEERIAS